MALADAFQVFKKQGLPLQLRERLIQSIGSDDVRGPTWAELPAPAGHAALSLKALRGVDRWACAMKANWHAGVLGRLAGRPGAARAPASHQLVPCIAR